MPLEIEDIINECANENHKPDHKGGYYKNYEDIKSAIKFKASQTVTPENPVNNLFNEEINFLSQKEFETLLFYAKLKNKKTAQDNPALTPIYKSIEQDLSLELTGKRWYHYLPRLTKLTPIGIALIFAGIGLSTLLNYIDGGKPADAVQGIPGPTIALIGGFLIMTDILLWILDRDYKKQLAQLFQFIYDKPIQEQEAVNSLNWGLMDEEKILKFQIKPVNWFNSVWLSPGLIYSSLGIGTMFGVIPTIYMALTAGGIGDNRSMMALPKVAMPALLGWLCILHVYRIIKFERTKKSMKGVINPEHASNTYHV